jgi:hypothetical protein
LTAAVAAISAAAAVAVLAAMTVLTIAKLATHLRLVKLAHLAAGLAKARVKVVAVLAAVKVLRTRQQPHAALMTGPHVAHAKSVSKPDAHRLTNLPVQRESRSVVVGLMPKSEARSRVSTVKV